MDHNERIAIALERIASALESTKVHQVSAQTHARFLMLLVRNRESLRGRMTIDEIERAIGAKVARSDRVAIGNALTEFGAVKGKSGSLRYYVFP